MYFLTHSTCFGYMLSCFMVHVRHIHLRVHAFGIDFYQSVAKGFFVFAVTSFLLSIAI